MTIYRNWHGAQCTAQSLIEEAEAVAFALQDEPPTQMHRRAVRGRRLVPHLHGWDRWACNGRGGITVSLRIEGQMIGMSSMTLNTRHDAETLLAELVDLLAIRPVPVPGDRYERQ